MEAKKIAVVFFTTSAIFCQAQLTGFDKGVLIGNLLVQGYQAIKGSTSKNVDPNAKTVDSYCFKNKMDEKIYVRLNAKIEDEDMKKELVIQKDTKECTFNLPKGVYSYEIALSSKDIYKKGEFNISEEQLVTIKPD